MGLVAEALKRSTLVEKKLPRDADGDGIIYEGTPLERPLRPGDKILHEGKPKVVQSIVGRRIRLKERGYPKPGGGRGDLFVEVRVAVPSELTEQERRLFEELAKVSKFDPRA